MKIMRLLKYLLLFLGGISLLAVVLYAIPVVSGVLDDTMAVHFSRPDPALVVEYSNGLTPEQKETYFHL